MHGSLYSLRVSYLHHLVRTSGPRAPATVAVMAGSDDWIEPQVSEEIAELFPSARRVAPPEADLVVVAAAAGDLPQLAATARAGWRRGSAVWLYAVDEGRVEALADAGQIRAWSRRRALGSRLEGWVLAHPVRWRLLGPATQRLVKAPGKRTAG
jgi:hypothetical protein